MLQVSWSLQEHIIHGSIPIEARHTHQFHEMLAQLHLSGSNHSHTELPTKKFHWHNREWRTKKMLQDRLSCVWKRSKIRLVCALWMERLKMCGKMKIVAKTICRKCERNAFTLITCQIHSFDPAVLGTRTEILPDLCLPAITCVHRWIW